MNAVPAKDDATFLLGYMRIMIRSWARMRVDPIDDFSSHKLCDDNLRFSSQEGAPQLAILRRSASMGSRDT